MKIAIVYYSRSGNTKKAAELIEKKLKERNRDVDLIEVQAVKNPGFLSAGFTASRQKDLALKTTGVDLRMYDTFLVGTPIWAGKPAPFLKPFFSTASHAKEKKAAVFFTCGGPPGSQDNAYEIVKSTLQPWGLTVSEGYLSLQMENGVIKLGEEQIDTFLSMVIP